MTSPALDAIAKLRRLAVALAAGDADHRWLAARLGEYLIEAPLAGRSLDSCVGLDPGLGGQTWCEQERRLKRDTLLCQIATLFFPGYDPGPTADKITIAWEKYDRLRRGIDQRRGMTEAAQGTLDAALFALGQVGGPPGWRRTRDLLIAGTRYEIPTP